MPFVKLLVALVMILVFQVSQTKALDLDDADQFQCTYAQDCPELHQDFSAFCASDNRCGYLFNKPQKFSKPIEATKPQTTATATQDAVAKGEVVALTEASFEAETASGVWAVKFFAPWCGHCKKMAGTWEEVAGHYRDDEQVHVAEVDCTQHKGVCSDFGVRGYPTIKLLNAAGASNAVDYRGARTLEEFSKWIDRESPALLQ